MGGCRPGGTAIAALTVLTVLGTVLGLVMAPPPAAADQDGGVYVALGDSFAAGPLIPAQTTLTCLRSDRNYPQVLARRLQVRVFRDVSCDGAGTPDMTSPQHRSLLGLTLPDAPPQFDALSADTTLVTLTIGGGDTGLVGVAQNCLNLLPEPWGKPCVERYTQGGTDQVAARIEAFGPKLGTVLDQIHIRAPQARVVVTGYGTYIRQGGCWPRQPFLAQDADFLQGSVARLNRVIAEQAAGHGAGYVDLATPGIGHDSCGAPGTKWLEGVVPTAIAAPLHPNALGMANFARIIGDRIQAES
ncbi:SGNH/GDSL hydrolase family protein [Actinomadura scrupuli]|uniref:SGNH/GDSL hydrolase family protein n=1 Tax=Actinomadura scrupuli TaxID=559629 RepID=UPI003D996B9A